MEAYRPDRVVKGLTALVSIAYFGLSVLAVIVLIGLPSVKVLGGNHPDWVIGLTVPVVSQDSGATVLTRWGDARLEMVDLRGSLRLPVSILPWWVFAVLWAYTAAAIGLALLFLYHLRRIFQSVRGGAPFDAANAVRLRWLGLVGLALALLRGVSEFVTALAVRGEVISDHLRVPLGFTVNGSLAIFALVLLTLAEIFRRGTALEEERALTI